jgi:5-methylcytosine-specific restriction endonuclease McrA
MPRTEFKRSVIVARIKASMRNGTPYCNKCGLPCTRFQIDHIRADGLLGDNSVENSQLLCIPCHKEKTIEDVGRITKAKHVEAKHLGAKIAPKRKIESRGFRLGESTLRRLQSEKLPIPSRRNLYE